MAPLGPSPGQHRAPSGALHARPKSMRFSPPAAIGLEGSLRHPRSSLKASLYDISANMEEQPMEPRSLTLDATPAQHAPARGPLATILNNLRIARLDRYEIAGSLGDLGTFLPLLVGMVSQNGLDFTAALFFAGLFNVITGLTFSIPMAVQPMKAIAAIALTQGLTVPQILAAGAIVSVVILLLGLTGLIGALNRVIPKSVVRGIQLAVGLSLLMKALQMVAGTKAWFAADSYLTGALGALLVLALFFSRRVPAALVLFGAGIVLAVWKQPQILVSLGVGFSLPHWSPPHWADFVSAFGKAALPQIPLTTLNSVIAVCALSADLFPDQIGRA